MREMSLGGRAAALMPLRARACGPDIDLTGRPVLLMSVVPQGDAGRRQADGPGGSRQRKTVRSLLRVGVLLKGKPDRDAGRREVAGPQGISYGTIIARSSAWGCVVAAGDWDASERQKDLR
ncbi:hypothetical protein GCM10009736_62130 [Actinomadura bangladeshensis]